MHPASERRLDPIFEAVRLRRSSRYPIEVSWSAGTGGERHGELTVDLVSDAPDAPLHLLLILRALDQPTARSQGAPGQASDIEARILALAATGRTSTRIATEVGLTADGVNYHLTRLSRRWGTANRTALIARAYVKGILAPHTWPPAPAPRHSGP